MFPLVDGLSIVTIKGKNDTIFACGPFEDMAIHVTGRILYNGRYLMPGRSQAFYAF